MYSKEQLMHMKRKILLRIANYYDIKGASKLSKEELASELMKLFPLSEGESDTMSVRIRRIKRSEEHNE